MITDIAQAARAVLLTADARAKAACAKAMGAAWRGGRLERPADWPAMPGRPARPAAPHLLPPGRMPKRGKAGSQASRVALLHALAHIELNAIDLAWDLIGRFGAGMPDAFITDWVGVGCDESLHFLLLADRLEALGSFYGALPAHDGLWEAAESTHGDLVARLAVVPMVLEARGLDVTPQTISRLRNSNDMESAEILQRIYTDEVAHVGCGVRWFEACCATLRLDPAQAFESALKSHFRGSLKPPFNLEAREKAGFSSALYLRLASGDGICNADRSVRDVT